MLVRTRSIGHAYVIMDIVTKSSTTLKDLRIKSGKTQHEVAMALNVRAPTVSTWERGLKEPYLSVHQMVLLCELYDCTIIDIANALNETAKLVNQQSTQTENKHRVLVAS